MDLFSKLCFLLKVTSNWLKKPRSVNEIKPIHIFFAMTDHYEPGTGGVCKEIEIGRVDELLEKSGYPVRSTSDIKCRGARVI